MIKRKRDRSLYRDAGTGKFVTEDYAERHKKTTVKETIRIKKSRKK